MCESDFKDDLGMEKFEWKLWKPNMHFLKHKTYGISLLWAFDRIVLVHINVVFFSAVMARLNMHITFLAYSSVKHDMYRDSCFIKFVIQLNCLKFFLCTWKAQPNK